VLGITHTDAEKYITETFKKCGCQPQKKRINNAIVEFELAAANVLVEPKLPFDTYNIRGTVVTWRVDSTDSSVSDGSSITDSDHSTMPLIHRSRKKNDVTKPSPHAFMQVKIKPKSTAMA